MRVRFLRPITALKNLLQTKNLEQVLSKTCLVADKVVLDGPLQAITIKLLHLQALTKRAAAPDGIQKMAL